MPRAKNFEVSAGGSASTIEEDGGEDDALSAEDGDDSDVDDDEISVEDDKPDVKRLSMMLYLCGVTKIEEGTNPSMDVAVRALTKCREIVLAQNQDLQKLLEKALKRSTSDQKVPPGSALVQRQLTDDRFLLCMTCVRIATANLSLGVAAVDVQPVLREALIWFPRSVQANFMMGEVLRCNAVTELMLRRAEGHYAKAVETEALLKRPELPPKAGHVDAPQPTSSSSNSSSSVPAQDIELKKNANSYNRNSLKRGRYSEKDLSPEELALEVYLEERAAVRQSREALALLLCQGGRPALAYPHLAALGFKFRLSRHVLHYPLVFPSMSAAASTGAAGTSSGDSSSDQQQQNAMVVKALDGALSDAAIRHLQTVFRPKGPFWSEHNYDTTFNASRTVGYFSYLYALHGSNANSSNNKSISSSRSGSGSGGGSGGSGGGGSGSGREEITNHIQGCRMPRCSVEQIIDQIYPIVCSYFPQAKEAKYGTSTCVIYNKHCYNIHACMQPSRKGDVTAENVKCVFCCRVQH